MITGSLRSARSCPIEGMGLRRAACLWQALPKGFTRTEFIAPAQAGAARKEAARRDERDLLSPLSDRHCAPWLPGLLVTVVEVSVTAAAGAGGSKNVSDKLGLSPGLVVQELGWDEDVDDDVRIMIEDAIDGELVEEAMEAVDLVLLWWRDEDGDLVDGLFDALTDLTDTGYIWLMTPKVGRSGYVDAADVAESALTAGLALTNSVQVSPDWTATKLVRPKGARR